MYLGWDILRLCEAQGFGRRVSWWSVDSEDMPMEMIRHRHPLWTIWKNRMKLKWNAIYLFLIPIFARYIFWINVYFIANHNLTWDTLAVVYSVSYLSSASLSEADSKNLIIWTHFAFVFLNQRFHGRYWYICWKPHLPEYNFATIVIPWMVLQE